MPRRTKIVATLGPATDGADVLDRIIKAGVDVVRLNLSHDSPECHWERARLVRERATVAGREIAVLVDLQGPKIRIGAFRDGRAELKVGEGFMIDADCGLHDGDGERVGTTYSCLAGDLSVGDILLLDDGAIELLVEYVQAGCVRCKVVVGGTLSSKDIHEVNKEVIDEFLRRGTVREGDLVIITKGDRNGVEVQTKIMKIMRVGEHALLTND